MKNSYMFFQNRECEYFPCHSCDNPESFNCLFCYCPLYALGRSCGGDFIYNEKGIKDCTNCLLPHRSEEYDRIPEAFWQILEAVEVYDRFRDGTLTEWKEADNETV